MAAAPATGIGYGAYFDYARGIPSDDFAFDDNRYNVGFTLDTAVGQDRLFNYRLKLLGVFEAVEVGGSDMVASTSSRSACPSCSGRAATASGVSGYTASSSKDRFLGRWA